MVDLSDQKRLEQFVALLVEARTFSEVSFARVLLIHLLGWAVFAVGVWFVATLVVDAPFGNRPLGGTAWLLVVPLGAALFSFLLAVFSDRDARRREARFIERQIGLIQLGGGIVDRPTRDGDRIAS
jgi:hypothetical protein